MSARRNSMPVNFSSARESDVALSAASLSDVEHLEILIHDMRDICEYGEEILKSFNNTREKFIKLNQRVLELQEENSRLFEEIFKCVNDIHQYLDK